VTVTELATEEIIADWMVMRLKVCCGVLRLSKGHLQKNWHFMLQSGTEVKELNHCLKYW